MKRSFTEMQTLIEKEKEVVEKTLKKIKKEMKQLQEKAKVLNTFSESNFNKISQQFKTEKDEIIKKIVDLTPVTAIQHEYKAVQYMDIDKYCIHGFSILKKNETWFQLVRVDTENYLTWTEIAPYHGNSIQQVVDKMENGRCWFEDCAARGLFPKALQYLNRELE